MTPEQKILQLNAWINAAVYRGDKTHAALLHKQLERVWHDDCNTTAAGVDEFNGHVSNSGQKA